MFCWVICKLFYISMSYTDCEYSCWWALPSSKQFSWFCRTARIITLLSTLNCNIYYAHHLKRSTRPVHDVSCSSQNSDCLEVWPCLAWQTRGSVQKQDGGHSVGPRHRLHGLFPFWQTAPLLLLPACAPRPGAGIPLSTWRQRNLENPTSCATSEMGQQPSSGNESEAHLVRRVGTRKGPTALVQKEQDEKQAGNKRDR